MDGFNSSSASGADREKIMESVRTQLAVANIQELLKKVSDKCFAKCVTKPSTSLDKSEQKCVGLCMDRYMDAWNLVSRTYATRVQKESHRM